MSTGPEHGGEPVTAYVVVDTQITDAEEYERYKLLARPMVEAHGGTYLARGGELTVIDEELWSPSRLVLLSFPNASAARTFFASSEYESVAAIRHANAKSTVVIVEGE